MFRTALESTENPECKIHFLSFKNRMITATASARSRIWISAYVINCNLNRAGDPITMLFATLRHKMSSGVDVRIICDDPAINKQNYHCNKFMMSWIERWNIPYCTPTKKITAHMKCILIDDNVLFIGSHNLAKSSLGNPLECTVELQSAGTIAAFAEAYNVIWHDAAMIRHMPPFPRDPNAPPLWMEH